MAEFKVVVSDYILPDLEIEREMVEAIGGELAIGQCQSAAELIGLGQLHSSHVCGGLHHVFLVEHDAVGVPQDLGQTGVQRRGGFEPPRTSHVTILHA